MNNEFNKKISAAIIYGIGQVPTCTIDEEVKKVEMMMNLSKLVEEGEYEFIMEKVKEKNEKEKSLYLRKIY